MNIDYYKTYGSPWGNLSINRQLNTFLCKATYLRVQSQQTKQSPVFEIVAVAFELPPSNRYLILNVHTFVNIVAS